MSKPKVYRYEVPGEPEFHPATFVGAGTAILDDDGYFSACTDYGNYAFNWKEKGHFRQKFVRFDGHYILGKIARETKFDLMKGVKALEAEGVKISEDLINIENEHEFQYLASRLDELESGDDVELFYDYPDKVKSFVAFFIPRLQSMIKAELAKDVDWIAPVPTFTSPLRYPGGKSKVTDEIKALMPKQMNEYREPFVGGGSVFMMARNENLAHRYWINDKFKDLYEFYRVCQDDQLCRDLIVEMTRLHASFAEDTQEIKKFFAKIKHELNTDLCMYNRAKYFFFLNRVTFSGTIQAGGFSKESAVKRFTKSSIERLTTMTQALAGVKITNDDFEPVITAPGHNVFMFLDPPYYTAEKLYGPKGELHEFDHEKLASVLKQTPHKFLLTYDDTPEIRKLYQGFNLRCFNIQYGMNNTAEDNQSKVGKEIFIRNYE